MFYTVLYNLICFENVYATIRGYVNQQQYSWNKDCNSYNK